MFSILLAQALAATTLEPRIRLDEVQVERGPLDPELARRTLAVAQPRLRRCFEWLANHDPEVGGALDAQLVVAPDGRATIESLDAETRWDETFTACVDRQLVQLSFLPREEAAPPTEPSLVSVQLRFWLEEVPTPAEPDSLSPQ
jgi:hypothetical protein